MSATEYRPTSWKPYELLDEDKMNQEAFNVQWLYEHTPRVMYSAKGVTTRTGVKIACGKTPFVRNVKKDQDNEQVNFNNFFSNFCQPVIATGIISNGQRNIFATHCGIGGLHPTSQGFIIRVEIAANKKKNDAILQPFWVSWIAMGY